MATDNFGREKNLDWDELDNEGKIKRLSNVVNDQNLLLEKLVGYLNQLIDHDHLGGKIVQPIGRPTIKFLPTILPAKWLY